MSKADHSDLPKLGISIGDINGISVEVIIKALMESKVYNYCIPIIYGSSKALSYHRKAIGANNFNFKTIKQADQAHVKNANIINCWEEEVPIQLGEPSDVTGEYSLIALDYACNDLKTGNIDMLVTAPIDKNSVAKTKSSFSGHTEYITSYMDAKEHLMLMVDEKIKIGTVTNHLPLKEVANRINTNSIISKTKVLNHSLEKDFNISNPIIAILGLNPHAGDNGLLGDEEEEIIKPAIAQLKEAGIKVFGPYGADGFFGSGHFSKFDGILSMYHDQALIPFKTLAFGGGVNFTAGLPIIRTSPDHGTAYELAGKNEADHGSMLEAIFTALDIYRNNKGFKEATHNPLKKSILKEETN